MVGKLRVVVLAASLAAGSAAAQVDSNLQALLAALMNGSDVTLLSPLADGTIQVTSFRAPGQRSAAEAAALISRAQANLANLGVTQPTGQQLATALVGGPVDLPSGRTSVIGVLPPGTTGTSLNSQVVSPTGLPQVVSPAGVAAAPNAAAGGSAFGTNANPPAPNGALAGLTLAQQTQALQLANSQLAALGITQPTPQQVNTVLQGGTLVTPSGSSVTVPGLLSGQAALAPQVAPAPASSPANRAPMVAPLPPSTATTIR